MTSITGGTAANEVTLASPGNAVTLASPGNTVVIDDTTPIDVNPSTAITLDSEVTGSSTGQLVRSVTEGRVQGPSAAVYDAVFVDSENSLVVNISQPNVPYEGLPTTFQRAVFQGNFVYDRISSQLWDEFTATNGTLTATDSLCEAAIAADIGSYAVIRSKTLVQADPGLTVGCIFGCAFNAGVATSIQQGGIASQGDGYSVAYNGTEFSVLRSYGGLSEIRTFTITGAATGSETATFTLNGTNVDVDLTNAGGDLNFTAFEIAQGDYSSAGFYADAVDDTVVFTGIGVGAKSGSYAVSSSSLTGTFAQTKAGADKTNVYVSQSNFNIDTIDGSGKTNFNINPQNGNLYKIELSWDGFNSATFSVFAPTVNRFIPFHRFQYANSATTTPITNPALPFEFAIASLGSTTAMTAKLSSAYMYESGNLTFAGLDTNSVTVTRSSISSNTETPVLTLRPLRTFRGFQNNSTFHLANVSIKIDGTKPGLVFVRKNCTSLGSTTTANYTEWLSVDDGASAMSYDATADTFAGGIVLDSLGAIKEGDGKVRYDLSNITWARSDTITFTALSSATLEVTLIVTWAEQM